MAKAFFESHFKNKKIEPGRVNDGEIFMDSRLIGVSLQRNQYCSENLCKALAMQVPHQKYVGFMIFDKERFLKARSLHQGIRSNFEAEIMFTPLDEDNNIIADKSNIFIDTPKNPSHSDLYYIDPAIIEPESPNIAIRFFSRQLCKLSKLVMDYPSLNDTCTHVFADIYSD